MQIRTFDAQTMEMARAALRAELGADALILATEEIDGGVRITAAIEPENDLVGLLGADRKGPDPALGPLMAFHGVPVGLRARLAGPAAGAELEPGLALALGTCMRPAPPAPRRLLLGLPGHGKTLATLRLATGLASCGEAPRVVVLQLADVDPDPRLVPRLERLGISVAEVRGIDALSAAIAAPGPVIVDTPGLSPLAGRSAARLRDLVHAAGNLTATLVLSVEGQGQGLLEIAADFLTLGCRSILPTKLDLTRRYGGLVALACGGVALAPASVSSEPTDALATLQPSGLARLLVNRFEAHASTTRAEEGRS